MVYLIFFLGVQYRIAPEFNDEPALREFGFRRSVCPCGPVGFRDSIAFLQVWARLLERFRVANLVRLVLFVKIYGPVGLQLFRKYVGNVLLLLLAHIAEVHFQECQMLRSATVMAYILVLGRTPSALDKIRQSSAIAASVQVATVVTLEGA